MRHRGAASGGPLRDPRSFLWGGVGGPGPGAAGAAARTSDGGIEVTVDGELRVEVYTPESPVRHPFRLVRDVVASLRGSRHLAWRLLVRDLSALYRQTLLGWLWFVVPPVVTALIWVLLRSQGVVAIEVPGVPYVLYVMTGTLVWQVFADAVGAPLRMMTGSVRMLTKIHFPREALVLAAVGQVVFNFLVRLVILAALLAWFSVPVGLGALAALGGVVSLIVLGTAIGLLLTPIGLLYRDVSHGTTLVLQIWLYLTPVVYPPPEGGLVALLLVRLNPVSPLLLATRGWLLGGIDGAPSAPFVLTSCLGLVLLAVTLIAYRVALPILVERLGE